MKTLKYAGRFLMRSKSYTIINLLGLAFSLACCIILMRYIYRELTVDTHCIDRENIYGVHVNMEGSESLTGIRQINYDTVNIDKQSIGAIATYIPLEQDYIQLETNRYTARCLVTDSVFFQFFHYPVIHGNTSLKTPQSALLTEAFARKIFGNENPIGKVFRYSNGKNITVEGVIGEPKCKSSIRFDVVLSSTLSNDWERMNIELYHFLPGTDMEAMNRLGSKPRYLNNPQYDSRMYTFSFIPLKDIYWNGSLTDDLPSMFLSGSRQHITILCGVCILLLLTGILNFINIYLVAMLRRGKEYGLKKVFGARGKTLFAQIWTENFILVLASLLVAWFIIELTSLPIEHLFGYHSSYTLFDGILSAGILLILPLFTSIYPYIKYNYGSPIQSIRSIGWGNRSVRSRMFFLFVQYIVTFLLVILSLYFNRQLDVLLHTEPGFRTKDIMIANLVYESKDFRSYTPESIMQRRQRIMQLDNELVSCPFIELFEPSREDILAPVYKTHFINNKGEKKLIAVRYATPTFFKLYGIKIIEGRLPEADSQDRRTFLVANRAAMKALGYTSLEETGVVEENQKRANANASLRPIDAIVEDYFDGHLTLGTQPILYTVSTRSNGDLYQIAYTPGKKKELVEFLHQLENKVYGSEDFTYTLLEDDVKAMYAEDCQTAMIYSIFASIAIIVSALGLFGISLFDIRQRYREIAIRKVNGASTRELYLLLFRKYTLSLMSAFAIAIPLSCFLIYKYTQDFAVKAPVSISIFIIALLLVAVISLGTLTWQIHKAANIDPAKIMKSE